jgi:hypothetical protein
MENEDYELSFNDGSKFTNISGKSNFADSSGHSQANSGNDNLRSAKSANNLAHAKMHLKSAKRIERAIEDIMGTSADFEYFPIAIGRRTKSISKQRPKSAPNPVRQESPRIARAGSTSNAAYIVNTSDNTPRTPLRGHESPRSEFPTPPSTFTNSHSSCRSSSKKSKILYEFDFSSVENAPILYGCFKSNGNLEFQSGRNYFVDKIRKQEIRIRNGPAINYYQV